MNELQIFKNDEFGEIRTTTRNDEPMFCLADVCKILEIGNSSQAKTRLKKDGVITNEVIDSLGRTQTADFINESNLYKLIFQSRKPQAEKFSDWVTSEVLPAIRKHGMYATDELLNNPDLAIKTFKALKEERERNKQLTADNEVMKPKALFADAVSASHTSILVGDMAKILKQNGVKMGQNRFYVWLRDNGYLIKKRGKSWNMPTQKSMELGLFETKEHTHLDSKGSNITTKTPVVTGKGQIYFVNKFLKKAGKD